MNLLRPSRPLSAIGMGPLVAVCGALLLAAAPIFPRVAGWAAALLFLTGGVRILMNRRAARLPSLALKVVLFGLGAGGIAMTYGSMVGVEPGLSILLVLVSLKLLETNSERDFQVLVLLGYFLGLCDLFFSQELLVWLYVGVVFLVLTATLVHFHRGPAAGGLVRSLRLAGTLLLQAVPIVALLFLFFPRSNAAFRFQFSNSLMRGAGMSDRLAPGSVASLALSQEDAFRVNFPERNAPPRSEMYWRGMVLWRGHGLTWDAMPRLPIERRFGQLAGPAIVQEISLQPHGARWIFALDRPAGDSPRFDFMPGGFLQSTRQIFNTYRYKVVSRPENRETILPPEQLRAALTPGIEPSPRLRALVESWRAGTADAAEIKDRALRYFREEEFSYSLNPGTYGDDALEEFLFERRTGFCEHYAASFATLMRLAGVPARVVIGYHGGELNDRLGNSYVIVRQSDAHAWAEVWLKDRGWLRVDPTQVIAPERISSGLSSYLESRAAADDLGGAASATFLGWREVMRDLRLAWDGVNYHWDRYVLNFNEDEQRTFLALLGLRSGGWSEALMWQAIGVFLTLGALALWLRRPGRSRLDEAGRSWTQFCTTLAAAGLRREPWEGPLRFGERAAAEFTAQRDAILRVARLYARLRYAPEPPPVEELCEAVRALPKIDPHEPRNPKPETNSNVENRGNGGRARPSDSRHADTS